MLLTKSAHGSLWTMVPMLLSVSEDDVAGVVPDASWLAPHT